MEPFNKRIRNRMMPLILLIVAITACTPLAEETAPEGNAAPLANITIDTRNGGEEDYTILDGSRVALYVKDDTGNEKGAGYTYTGGNWIADSNSDVMICATGNYPAFAFGIIIVTYPGNDTYRDVLFVTWVGPLATTATTGIATAAPLTMQIATTRIKITVTGAYGETAADKLPDFKVVAALKAANGFDWLSDDPYTKPSKLIPSNLNATWNLSHNNGYSWGNLVPNTVRAGEELFTLTAQDSDDSKYGNNTYKVTAPADITFQAGHEYHYTIALTGGGEARITHQEITPFTPGRTTEVDLRTPGIYDEEDLRKFATDWNTDPTTALTKWQDAPGSGIIRLMNNIDMTNESFTPIGTAYYNRFDNATFHGGGHTITGLTVNADGHAGLFGYVGTKGTVCHLHLREATITSTANSAGGIAGTNTGTLLACSVQGDITNTGVQAGGITGTNTGTLLACTFAGSLEARTFAGGIAGFNESTITACYSQAYDFKTTPYQYGITYNYGSGTLTACHWLTGNGLPATAGGPVGTITACFGFAGEAEFQANATYTRLMNNALATTTLPLQGGSTGAAGEGGVDYSWLHLAGAMPVVINTPPVAIGKSIATEADLRQFTTDWAANRALAAASWAGADGVIRLAADITLTDAPFPPIGTESPWNPFTAVFDGQGHTLTGLHIGDGNADNTGLFGYIGSTGVVRNLHLREAMIIGKQFVGGIAGFNEGILAACSFGGTVKATGIYAGGIAGRNEVAATGTYGVYGCYSIATSVTAESGTAYGIAAYNASTIHGCPWLVDAGQPATAGNNAGGTITACNSFTGVDAFNTGTYVEDMNAALDACGKATMKWSAVSGHYPKLEVQ